MDFCPKSLQELMYYLAGGIDPNEYFCNARWPEGVTCPRCGTLDMLRIRPHGRQWRCAWRCGACRHETSATAGTILHGSRLRPRKWLLAMWHMAAQPGISTPDMATRIKVHLRIAWAVKHCLRTAMARADRPPLWGAVECGIVPFRASDRRRWSRGIRDPVAIAAVPSGEGDVTVRFGHLGDIEPTNPGQFMATITADNATIITDQSQGLPNIAWGGRTHAPCFFEGGLPPLVTAALPAIHGLYQGPQTAAIDSTYIPYYLAEAEFAANRRHLTPGERFCALLGLALQPTKECWALQSINRAELQSRS